MNLVEEVLHLAEVQTTAKMWADRDSARSRFARLAPIAAPKLARALKIAMNALIEETGENGNPRTLEALKKIRKEFE